MPMINELIKAVKSIASVMERVSAELIFDKWAIVSLIFCMEYRFT